MSVQVNIPQVQALRQQVEAKYGEPLATHNCFIDLVDAIEVSLHEHLSESTLERFWGYSSRHADAVSIRTLNVLSKYVGFDSWPTFCEYLRENGIIESEEFVSRGNSVSSSKLTSGMQVSLSWLPDRTIRVEYLGDNRFVVKESVNSSIQAGDSFQCLQMQEGHPLYLDNFRRPGSDKETRYVVGERNGLTTVKIL